MFFDDDFDDDDDPNGDEVWRPCLAYWELMPWSWSPWSQAVARIGQGERIREVIAHQFSVMLRLYVISAHFDDTRRCGRNEIRYSSTVTISHDTLQFAQSQQSPSASSPVTAVVLTRRGTFVWSMTASFHLSVATTWKLAGKARRNADMAAYLTVLRKGVGSVYYCIRAGINQQKCL